MGVEMNEKCSRCEVNLITTNWWIVNVAAYIMKRPEGMYWGEGSRDHSCDLCTKCCDEFFKEFTK